MLHWHENDSLWDDLLPLLDGETFRTDASAEAQKAASLLKIPAGAHILDLGCGPGRHTVALARLGYRVTGVDRTSAYVARAKQRTADAGVQAEFVQDSMLSFERNAAFDGAINLFSTFGYFENRADDLRVMANVCTSLKPGARMVVDLVGKEFLAGRPPKDWHSLGHQRFWLESREVLPGWEKVRVQWTFVGGGQTKEYVAEIRIYSGVELREMMLEAGFVDVELFGGLDGRPYDHEATRLVAVGQK